MYHVRDSDGTVRGPVDRPTLDAWIAERRVTPRTLVHGGASAEWLPLSKHPDFAAAGRARPGRRLSPRLVVVVVAGGLALALLVALAAAAAPLARSGRWDLLPDVVLGGLRGSVGATPHPAAPVRSDSRRVREEPLDGIRIEADAGALDRDREFSAEPLGAKRMADADKRLSSGGLVALGGYDIDCGMSDDDLFYEPATISFDLEALGVPEAMREDVGIVNLAEDGTVHLVQCHRKGDTLSIEARHNGTWIPVLLPVLIGVADYAWTKDREEIPKGDFASIYWKPSAERFRVMYPCSWAARNPAEVRRVEGEYARLIKKHKLTAADVKIRTGSSDASGPPSMAPNPLSDLEDLGKQLGDRLQRLANLYSDPEYVALRDMARSERWLTENYLPVRVTNALVGLDRGWDYLDSRGFRKPGIAKFPLVTDVYVVERSLGAELYGEVHNTWTTSPFIVLDGTKIPDADIASFSGEQKTAFDEYQMTAMHELFHVVQSAYVFMDRNKYLWFNEAAAVVLEAEAQDYYVNKKGFAATWDMTVRSYASFLEPMEYFHPDEAKPNQQHGYGQAHFWEFLRDRYFTTQQARDGFLPRLYEDFATVRGGAVESLYRTTGGSPEKLAADFDAFTLAQVDPILTAYGGLEKKPRPEASVEPRTTPGMSFAQGGTPLSADAMEIVIPAVGGQGVSAKGREPVHVLTTNGVDDRGCVVRLSEPTRGRGAWDPVIGGCVLPETKRMQVLRTEAYVKTPQPLSGAPNDRPDYRGPFVFGMYAGEAPVAEVDDQSVTIRWPQSVAALQERSDGSRILIFGWRVTLTMPDGRSTTFAAADPSIEMPLKVIDKLMAADRETSKNRLFRALHSIGQADMITLINISEALSAGDKPKIKVTYREVADIPGLPLGPVSEVGEFEYGDEERTLEDVTGTWAGRVPFSEGEMMRLDISQRGSDFIGTMHWGPDALPIRGTWDPKTRSWAIDQREENVWVPMFLVAKGRLQKLPGSKLYLYAPPALLSRTDDAEPDLGWEPEAEDIEFETILQQLQYELDQAAPPEGSTP